MISDLAGVHVPLHICGFVEALSDPSLCRLWIVIFHFQRDLSMPDLVIGNDEIGGSCRNTTMPKMRIMSFPFF